jgi:hypothetical protein
MIRKHNMPNGWSIGKRANGLQLIYYRLDGRKKLTLKF